MATPTYTDVLTQINTYIVANGNNEITANILNPILDLILDFANNNIGDLSALTTDEKNNIVEAINSLKNNLNDLVNNGVQLHQGYVDPNAVPPASYTYADFYMQLDLGDNTPIVLWQWNGFVWKDTSVIPVIGLPEQLDFEANGVDNFIDIETTEIVKSVFYGSVIQLKENWTQTDNIVTFTFIPDAGAGYKNLTFI